VFKTGLVINYMDIELLQCGSQVYVQFMHGYLMAFQRTVASCHGASVTRSVDVYTCHMHCVMKHIDAFIWAT
jgi:hypothetical protein